MLHIIGKSKNYSFRLFCLSGCKMKKNFFYRDALNQLKLGINIANKYKNNQSDERTIITFKKTRFPSEKYLKKLLYTAKKIASKDIFCLFHRKKTTSGIHLHSKNLLDSLRHGVTQALGYFMQRVGSTGC
jgi:hypothetical protein